MDGTDDSQQRASPSPIWQHFRMTTDSQSVRGCKDDAIARCQARPPARPTAVRIPCAAVSVVLLLVAGAGWSQAGPATEREQHASEAPPAMTEPASPPSASPPPKRDFGFKPPPAGSFVTQALVPWVNRRTGERFTAPTGGWQPPSSDWVLKDVTEPAQAPSPTRSGTAQ